MFKNTNLQKGNKKKMVQNQPHTICFRVKRKVEKYED